MPYTASSDRFPSSGKALSDQAGRLSPVVISDTVDLIPYAKALKVNAAGTLYLLPVGNYQAGDETPIKWTAVAGEVIPVAVARVFSTNTTLTAASDIIALRE